MRRGPRTSRTPPARVSSTAALAVLLVSTSTALLAPAGAAHAQEAADGGAATTAACQDRLVTFHRGGTDGDAGAVAITAQRLQRDMDGWQLLAWQVEPGTTLTSVIATAADGSPRELAPAVDGAVEDVLSLTFCGSVAPAGGRHQEAAPTAISPDGLPTAVTPGTPAAVAEAASSTAAMPGTSAAPPTPDPGTTPATATPAPGPVTATGDTSAAPTVGDPVGAIDGTGRDRSTSPSSDVAPPSPLDPVPATGASRTTPNPATTTERVNAAPTSEAGGEHDAAAPSQGAPAAHTATPPAAAASRTTATAIALGELRAPAGRTDDVRSGIGRLWLLAAVAGVLAAGALAAIAWGGRASAASRADGPTHEPREAQL